MKIVCAWCKKNMGSKPGKPENMITHSICPSCASEMRMEAKEFAVTRKRENLCSVIMKNNQIKEFHNYENRVN